VDFQRLFLFLIFSFSVLLLWDGWQRAQHPPVQVAATAASSPAATSTVPSAPEMSVKPKLSPAEQLAKVTSASKVGKKLHVTTDLLSVDINTIGGDIHHLEFLKQRAARNSQEPFVLLQKHGERTYIAQSGLLDNGLPTHNAEFTPVSAKDDYKLGEGQNSVQVKLFATTPSGVKVTKTYTFHRGSYLIDINYEIDNTSKTPIASSSAYFQFVRDDEKPSEDTKFVHTYYGPAIYTDESKFEKVKFSDIEKGKTDYPKTANDGWIAMLQHYFVAAWLPEEKTRREYYTKHLDKNLYAAGVILPVPTIEPGKSGTIGISLYAGPAKTSLDKIAPGLGLSVDYGYLTVIATPIFWLLSHLHGWVQNWGLAIILLTFLIKLAFFPLSAASYRSMAKMRLVAPKLEKIKKQYGEDRERLHKAMMELYRTEKINPLGGCLPIVIQIPVFISLYWVILSSVELRHAPFYGWINDLSAADPYYILPLIMGVSMFVQTRLSPAPPDPLQAKIMRTMPIVFSVMFFFFPAGLVLYSIVNNVLSITQQWYITRGTTKNQSKGGSKA
jgi:YidC/Oxa1 family membrane protein insertase